MALTQEITLKDSFGDDRVFQNAYIKVDQISGNKGLLQVVIGIYKEQGQNKIDAVSTGFFPSLDGKNFIAQAYDHVKTIDNFSNAQDC
jgi:pyridoxal/pyridoxine/pyridoxamine kinase